MLAASGFFLENDPDFMSLSASATVSGSRRQHRAKGRAGRKAPVSLCLRRRLI
jgi:hypothetical protein